MASEHARDAEGDATHARLRQRFEYPLIPDDPSENRRRNDAGGASPFLPHPTDAGDEQSRCGGGRPAPGKERTVVSVAGDFLGAKCVVNLLCAVG